MSRGFDESRYIRRRSRESRTLLLPFISLSAVGSAGVASSEVMRFSWWQGALFGWKENSQRAVLFCLSPPRFVHFLHLIP